MKLSLKEAKLTGLWASNCATYSTGLDFKICLRAQKVSWPFEKRASGVSQSTRLWFVGKQLRTKSCICTRRAKIFTKRIEREEWTALGQCYA